jgi:ATP-dependent exoDNAse (exonuclease V) beta subunit
MNPGDRPPDAAERERALDPACSFLVQAPAGAGKTELLVRRYLRLLAIATEPEEVLAITFTRKAAAEMQQRVAAALGAGGDGGPQEVGALVAAVRRQDQARGWNLARNPGRLRISTIDALNAALASRAPLSGGGSALRPVSEQPDRLYRLASRATLRLLGDEGPASGAVAALLRHLDNNPGMAEGLLARLLVNRDQWLPLIGPGVEPAAARLQLEAALERLVVAEVDRALGLLDPFREELSEVLHAIAINRETDPGDGPGGSPAARTLWCKAVARLVLTDKGWRKSFTVNDGIPKDQKDLKAHVAALSAAMQATPGLEERLRVTQGLPLPEYSPGQWAALEALLTLLPYAAAHLKLAFAAEGETDYAEVAAEARAALGDEGAPSELALRVDVRIRHILLDEFQDTSEAQYELLRALTRGWAPGDGRTVFLVGDPMQSIYRFRQAEVRLFLDVRDHHLPGIVLEFLRLSANFRSVPALVEWSNRAFPRVFPGQDDPVAGAIAFSPSIATRPAGAAAPAVTQHDSPCDQPGAEGEAVVRLVSATLAAWPDQDIGILVRSRRHASAIVALLRASRIECGANDLVDLGSSPLAADLQALTRALVHGGDRLAWLAVLRSPLGGLTLQDLHRLASACEGRSLADLLHADGPAPGLGADGAARLARVLAAFRAARARLGQIPLRDVVEGLWTELGGPALAGAELALVDLVLEEVDRHDVAGDCDDVLALARGIEKSRASLPGVAARVQVMTIHKAKGLQFDTVILPGLGRRTRGDTRPALLWQELPREGERDLLLAPINATGASSDPLYEFLWGLQCRQAAAETDRLLYVATTRARERLHLFGQLQPARTRAAGEEKPAAPARGSLLDRLWPVVRDDWPGTRPAPGPPAPDTPEGPTGPWVQVPLRRLPAGWRRPDPPAGLSLARDPWAEERVPVPYDWASAWTRQAGSVAHRWLQELAAGGRERVSPASLPGLEPRIRRLLVRAGVEPGTLGKAVDRVVAVLGAALRDPAGRWVLSPAHGERLNEFAVTVTQGARFRHVVIDTAFVTVDGCRWIVDYKTGSHEGGDRDAFLRSEVERYGPQLRAYAEAFAALEARPVRTALYFPLLGLLQPVDGGPAPEVANAGG